MAYYACPADTAECTDEPCRALDRIADIARSAERTAETIQAFLDRFSGATKIACGSKGEISPPVSGYSGQIERLSKAVQECDDLARALRDIG
jgi:hypothetical protein